MKCIFDILTSLKANTTTSLTFTLGVKRDTCYFSNCTEMYDRQQLSIAWKILSFVSDSYKDEDIFEL